MWRQNIGWYIVVSSIFVTRALSQSFFFEYVSPDLLKDTIFSLTYLGSCFAFTSLFRDGRRLNQFATASWKMSWFLIAAVVFSLLFRTGMASFYQGGDRLTWEPFGVGGPDVSSVFAFLALLYLYSRNSEFPTAATKDKVKDVILILPFVILCGMGGTRIDLFALLIGVILHFRPSKYMLFATVFILFLLPVQSIVQSFYGGLSRTDVLSARPVIWTTFFSATVSTTSTFWFGYGPGGKMLQMFGMPDAYFRLAHDLFLQVWFQYGVIAMLLAIAFFAFVGIRLFLARELNPIVLAVFTLVILTELFDGTFSYKGCLWAFAASYGIIFVTIAEYRKQRRRLQLERNLRKVSNAARN
ncbi:MAG: hypothetical protein M1469_04890 [Bacteroidetes bacterium]|nr:hypothetical protein [Bacteroidota bacterium]